MLFLVLLGIAAGVMVIVTVLLFVSAARKRKDDFVTRQPPPGDRPGDRRALAWAIIGGGVVPLAALILVILLSISGKSVSAAQGSITIEVTGHQWWWEVHYPADGFKTANEIHIPVGEPVVIRLTSADVIHSFTIPQLQQQQELIPGQTSTLTFQVKQPGTYHGECTEYCGVQHAHMDFLIIAQTPADYAQWVTQQKQPAPNPPVTSKEMKGEQAFLGSSCVYCHAIQGTNASGTMGPDLTHLASRETIGAGARPNTVNNLAGWILNSQTIKPGNKMPPMELDSDQLQAILAYLETLK